MPKDGTVHELTSNVGALQGPPWREGGERGDPGLAPSHSGMGAGVAGWTAKCLASQQTAPLWAARPTA